MSELSSSLGQLETRTIRSLLLTWEDDLHILQRRRKDRFSHPRRKVPEMAELGVGARSGAREVVVAGLSRRPRSPGAVSPRTTSARRPTNVPDSRPSW